MKKRHLVTIILLFFIISIPSAYSAENITFFPNLTYDSVLNLTYENKLLENHIPLNEEIKIPIIIEYQTFIPEKFDSWPDFIVNKFLFGSFSGVNQEIKLSISQKSDWGTFQLEPSEFSVDIPFENKIRSKTANLTIELSDDAPCVNSHVLINATCNEIKRLNKCSRQTNISFTPEYVPCITVSSKQRVNAPPIKQTSVLIHVKNCGNKESRVTPKVMQNQGNFNLLLDQPQAVIDVDETTVFSLTVNPSHDFEGNNTVQINVTTEIFPFHEDMPTSFENYQITFYHEPTDNAETESINSYWMIIGLLFLGSAILLFGHYKKYW